MTKKITVKQALDSLNTKYANTLIMLDDALVQFSEVFSSLSVYDIFLLIVLNTAIFDTVAYIIGSNFGKNYITPRISPNKTFEGLVGGISGSAILV